MLTLQVRTCTHVTNPASVAIQAVAMNKRTHAVKIQHTLKHYSKGSDSFTIDKDGASTHTHVTE